MLYEFAMTPELFDASIAEKDGLASVILVELLRGIAENGLLANLHKELWLRHVTKARLISLSPALKDKVLSCLSVLYDRHRLVRHPRCANGDPNSDQDWLNIALESHKRIPFQGIILSQQLINGCSQDCGAFVEFLGALDSSQWEGRRRRTLTLRKSNVDYRAALGSILRHAKALSLIDPWLNSHEPRYFNTVTICSNTMGQRGHARLQGRIHIHAEFKKQKPDGNTISDYLDAWEQKLRPLITADGHRFGVYLWESLPGSESMHDRFILTDQCGISVREVWIAESIPTPIARTGTCWTKTCGYAGGMIIIFLRVRFIFSGVEKLHDGTAASSLGLCGKESRLNPAAISENGDHGRPSRQIELIPS